MTQVKNYAARGLGNVLLWRQTAMRMGAWKRVLGASDFLCRNIRYVIRDMPTVPFVHGLKLPSIPQAEKNLSFASDKISYGLATWVFEYVTKAYSYSQIKEGKLNPSSFVTCSGEGTTEKGLFFLNFHVQSKHWPKGRLKMKTIPSFAMEVEQGDILFSFDIESGYHRFHLHPNMRDLVLFHNQGRYFWCIELPMG